MKRSAKQQGLRSWPTRPQSVSKQGKEQTLRTPVQTASRVGKNSRDKDLCYKRASLTLWIFSLTTGSSLSPEWVVKTRMQESNNCTSHFPQSLLPYLLSQFVSHGRGPQHNEFWQLKTTPETRSSQDISDSCLRATSFKSRCFPSALPTTQAPLASTELMLWSFVLSVQLRSLSRG